MSVIMAVIVFSLIILFHEFGHFLLAKLNGIVVLEFSLGMGPRLLSAVKGGTRYSLKLLPFGGSCMMLGEDTDEEGEGSFAGKNVWQRISVVAAGPLFNFILAWVLSLMLLMGAGVDRPVLLDVTEGFPAEAAGLEAGDEIISINGRKMHFYREVSDYVSFHQNELSKGRPLTVLYRRGGEKLTADIIPKADNTGRYVLGISGSSNYRFRVSLPAAAKYAFHEVGYWIRMVFSSLKMIFTGGVTLDDVSGPVGAVEVIGETYTQAREDGWFYVWLNMLNIAVLLSSNLGVMNLLPIPALDGGRLLFLLAEAVRRKRLDPDMEGRIHFAGLMLLMAVMVIVMFNDIKKILVP